MNSQPRGSRKEVRTVDIESVTWECQRCKHRFAREIIDLHFSELGCLNPHDIEDLEYEPYYGTWIAHAPKMFSFDPTSRERIEMSIESAKIDIRIEHDKERGSKVRHKDTSEQDKAIAKKWLPLAIERYFDHTLSRVRNMNETDEYRLELLLLKLGLLKAQIMNFLEQGDWEQLDEIEYFEDVEITVSKLMEELCFTWNCSLTFKG
jgi:hypothetical protein